MAGTINSLGIGSGVLTADIIDKLKANDTSQIITPIDNKITIQQQKGSALDLLKSLLTSFEANSNSLSDDTLYQKRTVAGNNDGVSVTALSGSEIQSFSISNTSMALKNVQESGSFSSETATVATKEGTMVLAIDGTNYNIPYTGGTKLSELKDLINNTAGEKITASVLQTGTNDYRLVLTSKNTGANQTISVSDSPSGTLNGTLLQKDSIISNSFSEADPVVATTGGGTYSITMNGITYDVAYNANDTMSQLVTKINNTVGSDVASLQLINVTDAQLVINSTASVDDPTFSVSDTGGLDTKLTTSITNISPSMGEIQAARDASFNYNGISITRRTNTFDDLIIGVSINLLQENASSNISITQNTQAIADGLSGLATGYNTLMKQLDDMTLSDLENGKVGIFNGDNTIKSIKREITKMITSVNGNGNSLAQYGIGLSQDGTMTFTQSDFDTQINTNPTGLEAFFSGSTDASGNYTEGFFGNLDALLASYTDSRGLMSTWTNGSIQELKSLSDNKLRSQALLNARYEIMTARFVAYDSLISKLNSQFSSLQQQISMAVNGTNQ